MGKIFKFPSIFGPLKIWLVRSKKLKKSIANLFYRESNLLKRTEPENRRFFKP